MQIKSFPDKNYTLDVDTQVAASQFAVLRDRIFWVCLIVMFGSFAGMVINGLLGIELLVWVFAVLFGVALIVPLALVVYRPRTNCPRCGSRMKRRYAKRNREPGDDLFLVCDHCKIYADAHLARE